MSDKELVVEEGEGSGVGERVGDEERERMVREGWVSDGQKGGDEGKKGGEEEEGEEGGAKGGESTG